MGTFVGRARRHAMTTLHHTAAGCLVLWLTLPLAADEPTRRKDLVWGEPVKGLRAAVELTSLATTAQARADTADATFPHGSKLDVRFHVENVGDRPVTFTSEGWRQGDRVQILDLAGNPVE